MRTEKRANDLLMQKAYYPLFVSLEGRICLVVGGGSVGERKIKSLLRFGATVRLLSRDLTPWIKEQCEVGRVLLAGPDYQNQDLDGVDMVFAATSDRALNRQIAADARRLKIWCNMATDPEEGSCIVPSVFQQGPLTVAISTGGLSPALARQIRETVETQFGDEWVVLLRFMGLLRKTIQAKGLDTAQNQDLFRKISQLPLATWIQNSQRDLVVQETYKICNPWIRWEELNQLWDQVWNLSSSSLLPSAIASERSDT